MREYAFIIPNREAKHYGGIERVGLAHANEFARNGLLIHLFAHRYTDPYEYDPSITLHRLPKDDDQAVSFITQTVAELHEQGRVSVAIQKWERPDLTTALLTTEVPVISTLQCSTFDTLSIKKSERERVVYTALTKAHKNELQKHVPYANIEVIGSGIDIAKVPFSFQPLTKSKEKLKLPLLAYFKNKGYDYLTVVGAIGDHKGTRKAIEIAQKANMPLVILGAPGEANAQNFRDELGYYFYYVDPISEERIAPISSFFLRENQNRHAPPPSWSPSSWTIYHKRSILERDDEKPIVFFYGLVNDVQKYELLRFATANLSCSGLEDDSYFEAYGLTRVEGPITGTPTVSYADPSWKEIVREGITGFTYSIIDEAVAIVKRIHEQGFDRRRCAEVASDIYDMSHAAVNLAHIAQRAIEK